MYQSLLRASAALLLVTAMLIPSALAQSTATLRGTVTDAQGQSPLVGAPALGRTVFGRLMYTLQ